MLKKIKPEDTIFHAALNGIGTNNIIMEQLHGVVYCMILNIVNMWHWTYCVLQQSAKSII